MGPNDQEHTAPVDVTGLPVNVTALVEHAMTASSVMWIDVPDDGTYAVWHAWMPGTPGGAPAAAVVVNGPGEQHLPWLPDEVVLTLRSADDGGRLLRITAHRVVLSDEDPEWAAAVEALRSRRQNVLDDAVERWRTSGTVTALRPFGKPLEGPGRYPSEQVVVPMDVVRRP